MIPAGRRRSRVLSLVRGAVVVVLGAGLGAACATATSPPGLTVTTPLSGTATVPITLSRPEGAGPFPAVVIMHDCSGLGPSSSGSPARWAAELVRNGHVVLIPDSFTPRGFPDGVCTSAAPRRNDASPAQRVYDAYAALAYLRTLPYVDGRRVGLMGGSHGGTTTVSSMMAPLREEDPLAGARRSGFAAAVALYPGCTPSTRSWRLPASAIYRPVAPLLILIGEKDDWTPAAPCQKLVADARAAGHPVEIKVYPGAHHSFDSNRPVRYVATRMNANAPGGRGATTGGDPAAWADAIREVTAFFGRHLK